MGEAFGAWFESPGAEGVDSMEVRLVGAVPDCVGENIVQEGSLLVIAAFMRNQS